MACLEAAECWCSSTCFSPTGMLKKKHITFNSPRADSSQSSCTLKSSMEKFKFQRSSDKMRWMRGGRRGGASIPWWSQVCYAGYAQDLWWYKMCKQNRILYSIHLSVSHVLSNLSWSELVWSTVSSIYKCVYALSIVVMSNLFLPVGRIPETTNQFRRLSVFAIIMMFLCVSKIQSNINLVSDNLSFWLCPSWINLGWGYPEVTLVPSALKWTFPWDTPTISNYGFKHQSPVGLRKITVFYKNHQEPTEPTIILSHTTGFPVNLPTSKPTLKALRGKGQGYRLRNTAWQKQWHVHKVFLWEP